jgi:hypothetical protein
MSVFRNITQLANHYEAKTLAELGRAFYDESEAGVSVQFLILDTDYHYSDENPQMKRPLPNIWAGCCRAIKFSTIVEGYDAEFDDFPISFPLTLDNIQMSYDYLNGLVNNFLNEEVE